MFVALDRWDSNEPLFTGMIQTPTDELSTGVAKDSLARLIGILSRTYALDTSHAQSGDSIGVPSPIPHSRESTGA